MNFVHELISTELQQFVACRNRAEAAILEERDFLQGKADEGAIGKGVINKMNYLLGSMSAHIEATDKLLEAINTTFQIVGEVNHDLSRLKFQVGDLERENRTLKNWLRSMGKDVSLLPYFRESDFRSFNV